MGPDSFVKQNISVVGFCSYIVAVIRRSVDSKTFKYSTIKLSDGLKEAKPYWATSNKDGIKAYVSISGLEQSFSS